MSKKKINIIKQAVKAFNAPSQFSSPDGEITINDVVPDIHNPTPDAEVQHEHELAHLEKLLDRVDQREATILKLRYGLDGSEPMTLKEIGKQIGLTRERVRQIEHEALKKLRDSMVVA
jgi:RNA polymerase primary sigma factor